MSPETPDAAFVAPDGSGWLERYPRIDIETMDRRARLARIRDLTLVVLLLPIWGLVLGIAMLAVWAGDPRAPVVFRQHRTGKDGRRFEMMKLRTMVRDAEARKADLMHLNELEFPDFKITNDPRITKVGRLLRKTSLDELPQLINVLKGDMALVGPRPTSFGVDGYTPWHTARLESRPGITGAWQVLGRAELTWDERVRLELAYASRQCGRLDLEILARTVPAVLVGSGR